MINKINELIDVVNDLAGSKPQKRTAINDEMIVKIFKIIEDRNISDWAASVEMGMSTGFVAKMMLYHRNGTPMPCNPSTMTKIEKWIEENDRED